MLEWPYVVDQISQESLWDASYLIGFEFGNY